jgi:hypothetical protein
MPRDCFTQEPHATLTVGKEAVVALRQENKSTDRANARVLRCAQYAEKHFAVKPAPKSN